MYIIGKEPLIIECLFVKINVVLFSGSFALVKRVMPISDSVEVIQRDY